jgi:radical SAM protein with 4Fe4S-binding SPASM domain
MLNKLYDRFSLVSSFTLKKTVNLFLIFSGYYFSRITKKPYQWGMPVAVSVEPTTACNLACPECPSGLKKFTRETGSLKEDFFKETINQLSDYVAYLTFYFQGEPYINPSFLEMVKYASAKNIYTATSTNAHFLNEENARKTVESGLSKLIISIDGTTQETYEKYRINGSLEKVIEGTKNVIYWKKKLKSRRPYIVFQFLVVSHNEHETDEVKKIAKNTGVDEVVFKTAQVYDYKNGNRLIPENEKYSRYRKQNDGTYKIKNTLENQCWRMWKSCVITWNGLVVPCCFDKDASHQLGDMKEKPFREIWFNGKYTAFRTAVLKGRSEIDICKNCTEGTTVFA